MFECFKEKRFGDKQLQVIDHANQILEEYSREGYNLTLRQLYYQFVARGIFDENSQKTYKRLGAIVNDARLAGLIDWDHIEDRTRSLYEFPSWDSPEEIIDSAARSFNMDLWEDQGYRPEVWVEKEALAGVIAKACQKWRIPYFSCRGYTSQSEQYRAGKRMARISSRGQIPIVFHFGDHDPSGCDMTRDNSDRLAMFADEGIQVVRLALNMDQVREFNPPPNPAKFTDSRCIGYIKEYGYSSWELDALSPRVLESLLDAAIDDIVDRPVFEEAKQRVEDEREILNEISRRYDDVAQYIRDV